MSREPMQEEKDKRLQYLKALGRYFVRKRDVGDRILYDERDMERVNDVYFKEIHPTINDTLEDSDHNFDRHKIVSGVSCAIMRVLPLIYIDDVPRGVNVDSRRTAQLNAELAICFALSFIGTWNKKQEISFCPTSDADRFFDEHEKFLASSNVNAFPLSTVAKAWYLAERVCLLQKSHEENSCNSKNNCSTRTKAAPLPPHAA